MIEGDFGATSYYEHGQVGVAQCRDDLFIKSNTIMIGDMEVPEPCREPLEIGQEYWLVAMTGVRYFHWSGSPMERLWLRRGLIQLTKERAISQSKATVRLYSGEV